MPTANDAARRATVAITDASGAVRSVGRVLARAVVLATGGYGQVFAVTSNPPAITGDGLALVLRAGLAASDLEFVQFHPTVLWRGAGSSGQQALVSEAVRGEGAVLYDAAGERVMGGSHSMDDLAPRDVVASAISGRMAERAGGVGDHVFLDATHMGERFYRRFPSITASCRSAGVDPARERIPVAPAAHYACGGVRADLDGRTELPGLYAVGEVACTGVHGANRLASNSLTEGIVAGTRAGRALAAGLPAPVRTEEPVDADGSAGLLPPDLRGALRAAMSRSAGVLRSADGLASAQAAVDRLSSRISAGTVPHRSSFEATNLVTVASAVLAAAHARTESRGCHRRTDFSEPRPEWLRHSSIRLDDVRTPVVLETHPRSAC